MSQPRQSCTSRPRPFFRQGEEVPSSRFPRPALERRRSDRWRSMPRHPCALMWLRHARPREKDAPPAGPASPQGTPPPCQGGSCARTRSPSAQGSPPKVTTAPVLHLAPCAFSSGRGEEVPSSHPLASRAEAQALGQVALHAPTALARLCGGASLRHARPRGSGPASQIPLSLCPGHRPCRAAARGHASGCVGARRPGPCFTQSLPGGGFP